MIKGVPSRRYRLAIATKKVPAASKKKLLDQRAAELRRRNIEEAKSEGIL